MDTGIKKRLAKAALCAVCTLVIIFVIGTKGMRSPEALDGLMVAVIAAATISVFDRVLGRDE